MDGKKYDIIYADPPWKYYIKESTDYPTMTIRELKELPIESLSKEDAVCFMWVTMPNLPQGIELLKSWGFTYKTVAFVWIKQNRKNKGLFMGEGYYTRSNAELCIIGTKGDPLKRESMAVRQIIYANRRKHSQKPYETYLRIEELYGTDKDKIELFARNKVEGWDVWGNEVKSDIILTVDDILKQINKDKGVQPLEIFKEEE